MNPSRAAACGRCKAPIVRGPAESPSRFAGRRFCGRHCAPLANAALPRPNARLRDWDTFAAAWAVADSLAAVAVRFRLTAKQTKRLASKMRRRGYHLKLMQPGRRTVALDLPADLAVRVTGAATRRGCSAQDLLEAALAPVGA